MVSDIVDILQDKYDRKSLILKIPEVFKTV